MFSVDARLGLAWLLAAAAFLIPKSRPNAIVFGFLMAWRLEVPILGLFVALVAVLLIGAVLGCPAGMAVGPVVGYVRAGRLPKAVDAAPEGSRPWLLGLLLPAAFLPIAVPFYLFWLTPQMVEWLAH
jgi:hypothetical protein